MACFETQLTNIIKQCAEKGMPIDEVAGEIFNSVDKVKSTRVEGNTIHLTLHDGGEGAVIYTKKTPALEKHMLNIILQGLPAMQEYLQVAARFIGFNELIASLQEIEEEYGGEPSEEEWTKMRGRLKDNIFDTLGKCYVCSLKHARVEDAPEDEVMGHAVVVANKAKLYSNILLHVMEILVEIHKRMEKSTCEHAVLMPKEPSIALDD